ncbi:NADPH:quinone reductase [Streptomyces sp. DvalAA-14]|uniref:zinc-dependent alcohol dehydrogenase family protein n=1 Tax=unclassified Streptomyces TaxID=2593676 RepID=UPI00081AEC7A|nr:MULTISPECIES: zinc-dependent alcohol dehydrogenase family protein [unclassified Streptomyces]MYS18748.1 zinc-binding dehydrogenase [Streptomyces sp. SID4948]SCD28680.1 NADPH:quinone reductase [Streptomyces sp. DvalAA-14]
MSRITLTGIGDPAANLRLDPDPEPRPPLGPDDVLLRMEAAPVNPVDFLFANGWYPVQPSVPGPIGAEGVGRVIGTGPAADRSLTGKRVVVLGTYEQGVWADTVAVPARNVVEVPEGVDAAQLSMAIINPVTAYLLLRDYADLGPGDWVAQTLGNSAVARAVTALARRAGIRTLNVVRSEDSAREARETGADVVLVDGPDLAERAGAALGGSRLRLVLDGVGGPTAGRLTAALESGGAVVSYASATGAPPEIPIGDIVFRDIALRGLWVVNWLHSAPRAEVEKVVAELVGLIAAGELSVPVDSSYPLDRYQDALARHRAPGRTGKVLFTFGPSDTAQA